jgi:hypothetical protein
VVNPLTVRSTVQKHTVCCAIEQYPGLNPGIPIAQVVSMQARRLARLVACRTAIGVIASLAPGAFGRSHAPDAPSVWSDVARRDALRRAHVWREPEIPIERADLRREHDALPDDLTCQFEVDEPSGTAPKFDCSLENGDHVKIKYGGAEPHGEVAATRLLRALGFGADRVEFVKRVRCRGCPWFPFTTMKVVQLARARGLYQRVVNYESAVEFEWVAVERKFPGVSIETDSVRGWSWHEVAVMKAAPRAHIDAFRLFAAFLAHWDNKTENQRLVCLPGSLDARGRCRRPFALIQDAGATFGPRKVDLDGWRQAPIWRSRSECVVSMDSLPHRGATFPPVRISEAGRRFLNARMSKLSDVQITALFQGARFDHHDAPIDQWVDVFKSKRRAVAEGPPCPTP